MNLCCKAILLPALLLPVLTANGQNTMYFMDRLPQTLQLNPASVPEVNFFIELPGVGSVSAEVYNSGFTLGEFLDYTEKLGKGNYNPETFIRMIGDNNRTMADASVSLFALGFRLGGKGYFSLSLRERNFLKLNAPSEFVYLLDDFDKIRDKMPLDIRGIDIRTIAYTQLALTWSRTFFGNLTLGFSPKLTGALAGVRSGNIYLKVDEEDEFDFTTEYGGDIRLGLPVPINPGAVGAGGILDTEAEILSEDWYEDLKFGDLFTNPGFAFDAGAVLRLGNRWTLSASVLDVGKLSWKDNAYLLTVEDEELIVNQNHIFSTRLPSRLILGANCTLSPRWNGGLMVKNFNYSGDRYSSATLSLNGHIGRMLSASVSYTADHDYDNLGAGLRLRFFPGLDLYAVTDNLLDFFRYREIHHATLAMGVNFSIGLKGKKSKPEEVDEQAVPLEPVPY